MTPILASQGIPEIDRHGVQVLIFKLLFPVLSVGEPRTAIQPGRPAYTTVKSIDLIVNPKPKVKLRSKSLPEASEKSAYG